MDPIRVGSFNALGKLTPDTLDLWADVLRAVPEAQLLLKTKELIHRANRERITAMLVERGIAPERLELHDSTATADWSAHMDFYSRLDIALDPVGAVSGGTTSCDALWMGAPVITLAGDRIASRMTASMVDAIGAPEMIATTEADYVAKVVALARDPARLDAIRASQRAQMASSPLCDAKGLASALEDAYDAMFDRWAAQAARS